MSETWAAPSGHEYLFVKLDEAIEEQSKLQGLDIRETLSQSEQILKVKEQVEHNSLSPTIQVYSRS